MKHKWNFYLIFVMLLVSCNITNNLLPKKNAEGTNSPEETAQSALSSEAGGILTKTPSSSDEPRLIEGATSIYQTIQNKYVTQSGTPLGMENFLHPALACDWMGVAGQVFDLQGQPQTGFVVQVGGELEGKNVLLLAITGGNTSVGVGGYEIVLSDHMIASTRKLWIQLYNLDGKSLSDRVYFDTFNDCSKNLLIINLTETVIAYLYDFFMPVAIQN
jgi:hypothetical protein